MSKPRGKNTAPALHISVLRPYQLDLTPGKPPMIVCPNCSRWVMPIRFPAGTFVPVHRSDDLWDVKVRDRAQGHRPRCGESWREVIFDMTGEQWAEALHHDTCAVRYRRGSRSAHSRKPRSFED